MCIILDAISRSGAGIARFFCQHAVDQLNRTRRLSGTHEIDRARYPVELYPRTCQYDMARI